MKNYKLGDWVQLDECLGLVKDLKDIGSGQFLYFILPTKGKERYFRASEIKGKAPNQHIADILYHRPRKNRGG